MPYLDEQSGRSMFVIEGPYAVYWDDNTAEYRFFAQTMAISFIRYTLGEPPEGCELRIESIKGSHLEDKVLAITFPFDAPDPDGAEIYALKASKALEVFGNAVDWASLKRESVNLYISQFKLWTVAEIVSSIDGD